MNKKLLLLCTSIVVVLEAVGFAMSVKEFGVGLFQYYTQDSNLMVLVSSLLLLVFLLKGEIPRWLHLFRYWSVIATTITLAVVLLVLAPMESLRSGFDGFLYMIFYKSRTFHHFICPSLTAVSFCLLERGEMLTRKDTLWAMIPTGVYAAVLIVLNLVDMIVGPYPFLEVKNQPVIASVFWAIGIFGVAYGVGALIGKLSNCKKNIA